MNRRDLLAMGTGAAIAGTPALARAAAPAAPGRALAATDFGAVGDGRTDDTRSLQAALDATFGHEDPGVLFVPPGTYRITDTLKVVLDRKRVGNLTRRNGLVGHGAVLRSEIDGDRDVLDLTCRSTVRYLLIDGLDIRGSGNEKHGLSLDCQVEGSYLYNLCLRDVTVEGCGGDGCRMLGNVFEGQIFNSYFRDNGANGIVFGHGEGGGILSSMHVFGCVFGGNGEHGAALVNNCYDVGFHGSYFLLNGRFGLSAKNGCTLLSNCGFENNHTRAAGFAEGGAGVRLQVFGTLLGCTAYSIHNQTHLVDAFVTNRLTLLGCIGFGDGEAERAGLARLQGDERCGVTLIGCTGGVEIVGGVEPVEIGLNTFGARFGSKWNSTSLLRLGDYRLWVDGRGRLRLKQGDPESEEDGALAQ